MLTYPTWRLCILAFHPDFDNIIHHNKQVLYASYFLISNTETDILGILPFQFYLWYWHFTFCLAFQLLDIFKLLSEIRFMVKFFFLFYTLLAVTLCYCIWKKHNIGFSLCCCSYLHSCISTTAIMKAWWNTSLAQILINTAKYAHRY